MRITGETATGELSSRRAELIVWLMALTAFAYVSLAVSLSPLLTSIAAEFGVSESAVGQLATIQGVVGTISAIVSAPWMGRFSRRTWLRAELSLLCLGVAISALAPSFPVMIAARVLIGVAAGALIANCFTAASEVVRDPARQGRAVGIVASGTTVATLIGLPAIAWLERAVGWRWALAAVLIPLGLALLGTFALSGGRGSSGDGGGHGGEAFDAGMVRRLLRNDRETSAIILATGSIFIAYIGWLTYYGAYLENDTDGGARWIGALFIAGGLAELAGNFGAPAMSHRFPVRWVAIAGLGGMALALLGSGTVFRSIGGLFAGIAVLHLATSFAYVGLNTLLVQRPESIRGTVMALSSAAVGLGGAIGALLGGLVLAVTGGYLPVFYLLGFIVGLFAIGLLLVFRSTEGGVPAVDTEGRM